MGGCETLVSLSGIDEERFGVRTARAVNVTGAALADVLRFCAENGVGLLIARCLCSDAGAAQAMEDHGFRLMDTLVYYARDLAGIPLPVDTGTIPVRPLREGEAISVQRVAAEAFRGYRGHYHADPRLDEGLCDQAYVSWAYRSCACPGVADQVLVADRDGIVAFATLRVRGQEEGEGVLFGVAPAAQGRGVYRSLMIRAMEWFSSRGLRRMLVSTQVTNVSVQKVWVRLGFEPTHSQYTFHKWFD